MSRDAAAPFGRRGGQPAREPGRFVAGRWLRVRTWGAVTLLSCGLVLLGYRAFILQVREAERLRQLAEDQYLRDVEIPPRRGRILDRHGVELAATAEVDSLACNQRALGDKVVDVAKALSGPLKLDRKELERRLRGKRYFAWVKRRLDPDEARAIRQLGLANITLVREPRRYYPNRELAGPLIGWAGVDAVGQEGLELEHDKLLRGTRAQVPGLRDALGRAVLIGGLADAPTSAGQDLTTTIDRHIQYRLEQALERAVSAHHAKAASAVAIDPRNGEVLAIAALPTFNPNDPGDAMERGARLRPVTDPLEPGSTMKTISVAAALEAGLTNPEEPFFCENGSYKVGPATIHDAEPIGDVTLTGVLAKSSNICIAKIAARQGRERVHDMLIRMGFGKPTGVDLPGERAGQVRSAARMGPVETATMAFGQGLTATPLQIASAYAVIANGGMLYRPHVGRHEPMGSRAIDESLAATLRAMLYAVTQKGGTAEKLTIPGYRFAGKTGTAQKVDPATRHYSTDKWASSFVGFAPLEEPRIVLYVMVDEPVGTHFGSMVAGPVFQDVIGDAMRWLGVRPTEPVTAPVVAAKPARKPTPALDAATPVDADGGGVPDLRGLGVSEAIARAARAGVRIEIVGSGLAVEQSAAPGDEAVRMRVTFRPPG